MAPAKQAGKGGGSKKGRTPSKSKTNDNKRKAVVAEERPPLFDDRMINDICGVVIAVISIALFIAVLSPGNAMLSNFFSDCLRYGFGVGAFVIPIALLIWGASFFVRSENGTTWRTGLGLALVVVAVISALSLFTPGADVDQDLVFEAQYLTVRGGYLGAGIAWMLLKLVGRVIGLILLIGLGIGGCIVLGFSISGLVEKFQNRFFPQEEDPGAAPRGRGEGAKTKRAARLADGEEAEGITTRLKKVREADKQNTQVMDEDAAKTQKISDAGPTVTMAGKGGAPDGARPSALEGFELPDMSLIPTSGTRSIKQSKSAQSELQDMAENLEDALLSFNVDAQVVGWVAGPTFTMFKVKMAIGEKLSKITNLQNDIQLALASEDVRIFAPIPGTSLVGIEIPNRSRNTVALGDILHDIPANSSPLTVAIGQDVEGESIFVDLATMPHLLIGGTTGSGKSVVTNSMIMSVLMRATPAEVRMILIDPKRVEFSLYEGIPHLFTPVVTEAKEAAAALAWTTIEMDRRLKLFQKAGTRNIGQYNKMIQDGRLDEEADELPFILVIIDELSDLMMVAGKEVEGYIVRIAQLARAAGIHLVVATQRPSSNVVTGMIKANITNRIALKTATAVDSRVILDQVGADKLVGKGDMLFSRDGLAEPQRIQGCFVDEKTVAKVVKQLKEQGEPEYNNEILKTAVNVGGVSVSNVSSGDGSEDDDPLLWEAAELVVNSGMGSTSNIQRRLKVGYARAGRIMDQLEEKGVVGPPDGSRPREVLVSDVLELETLKAYERDDVDSGEEF